MENKNPVSETQAQPTLTSQQSTSDQPLKQRGFVLPIIGAVIVLAIIGLGGYLLYQRQNTSNNQAKVETGKQILNSKTSPDGNFTVSEEILADYNKIKITDKNGRVITEDLVAGNEKEIGYNVRFKCQCGTSFKEWTDNSHFKIKIVNGGGEEYEFLVNAVTGKVDESSFMKISGSDATTSWKTYTTTDRSKYQIKFPEKYNVVRQVEGTGDICLNEKPGAECVVVIDTYNNPNNLTIENYININLKHLVDGPLIPYTFNGYNTLFAKSHPGTDLYLTHGSKIYHINAPTASSNKEVSDILSTFKFIDQQAEETANWKIEQHDFSDVVGNLSYKYPTDWIIEDSNHSGHPNYATLYNTDKSSCVEFTVTSESETTTIDEMFRSGLSNWDLASPTGTVLSSEDVTINNKPGKIEKISLKGKEFYAAVGELGVDPRFPRNKVFAFLTTCSLQEQFILSNLVKTILVKK